MAYDLFHCGFDVMIIDHRGQGRSGRLLSNTHRGHVVNFSDYVDDLAALWRQQVVPAWFTGENGFILALILWAGAIATLFLQRYRAHCDAIALCASDVRDYHSAAGLDGAFFHIFTRLG
ncbi:serine aminopeptidase domain-containing protein [Klebsiella pneumoniae]|uniref:serine aminopeptidase domain-containing protein n=1 Tax=Klebsiella pneumoniae TaxID=573 RepID=UPI00388E22FF